MDFDEILCDQKSWHLIDVKISIFLNNFRNNEWILIKFCLCIDIYDPCCD